MSQRVGATPPPVFILMGVSGCGKTSVGQALAVSLDCRFVEGDDYHPPRNRDLMANGIALTDEDRWPWLSALAVSIADAPRAAPLVVTCSALRLRYRDHLRASAGRPLRFGLLDVPRAELLTRLQERKGHYMPASLLDSQLDTLEYPRGDEGVWIVPVGPSSGAGSLSVKHLAEQILGMTGTLTQQQN